MFRSDCRLCVYRITSGTRVRWLPPVAVRSCPWLTWGRRRRTGARNLWARSPPPLTQPPRVHIATFCFQCSETLDFRIRSHSAIGTSQTQYCHPIPKTISLRRRFRIRTSSVWMNPWKFIVTGRNEVVAKVMFLQVCVCPQGGRVSASVHAGMPYPPDGEPPLKENPPMENPPDGEPPWMENPPGVENPPRWRTPPGWRTPPDGEPPDGEPPRKQTPAYGLQAASTHPTGMHSWIESCDWHWYEIKYKHHWYFLLYLLY